MIVMIILLSILGILLLCIVLGLHEFQDYPVYSEYGEYSYDFKDFRRSDQEKIAKKLNQEVSEIYRYREFPAKRRYKLVPDECVDIDDYKICVPLLIGIPFLIANVICGIICISNHTDIHREEIFTKYQMQINNLKEEAITIDNYLTGDLVMDIEASGSTYHVIVDKSFEIKENIINYNRSVNALKADLYMRKVKCSNPWTSWFWCDGATLLEDYNPDARVYTDILPHLMTYEIKKV